MTIEELAFKSGVKYSTVRNLWQGKVSNPNYSTLKAIAGAFGVTIEEMVDDTASSGVQSTEIQMPMSALSLNPAR
jgi:transcriptional regulator with XRE-family HTH domain